MGSLAPLRKQGFWGRIAQFIKKNPTHTKAAIVCHFLSYGVAGSAAYAIIGKFRTHVDVLSAGKGKIAEKLPIQFYKKLIRDPIEN